MKVLKALKLRTVVGVSTATWWPSCTALKAAGYPLIQLVRMAFSDVGPTNIIGQWNWVGLHNISAELTNPAFWTAAKTTGEFTLVLRLPTW